MAMAMRVAGDKEGNGDADKGGGQAMVMATKREMVTAARVVGKQQQWQWRVRMTVAAAMAMKITIATAMVGETYNNQLKVSAEEMMAAVATATERATVTATRQH
jgi:hypothetical protein